LSPSDAEKSNSEIPDCPESGFLNTPDSLSYTRPVSFLVDFQPPILTELVLKAIDNVGAILHCLRSFTSCSGSFAKESLSLRCEGVSSWAPEHLWTEIMYPKKAILEIPTWCVPCEDSFLIEHCVRWYSISSPCLSLLLVHHNDILRGLGFCPHPPGLVDFLLGLAHFLAW